MGAATTRVRSDRTGSTRTATALTTTGATSLLNGLVTADAITTQAKVTRSATGYRTSGTSTLVNLRIAGLPVDTTPSPDTTVSIPGIATVRLNAQSVSTSYGARAIGVTALRVTGLKLNPLGLPAGTVVVGSARSSLHSVVHNRPYGAAYAASVDPDGRGDPGPAAAVNLPCGGSNGKTLTATAPLVHRVGAVDTGAVTTAGRSTDSTRSTAATTTSTVAVVDLLDGTVTADLATARARAVRTGSTLTFSSTGTKVTRLKVLGKPVHVPAAANSTIPVNGIGTLTLRRTARTATGLQVYALQLELSQAVGDLRAGTVLRVGAARAGVTRA